MRWTARRGKKPVQPDDFSGVYPKRKRQRANAALGTGDNTNASARTARIYGMCLLVLAIFYGVCAALYAMNLLEGVHLIVILLFGLINGLFIMGELAMRREFPQRNLIMGIVWGSLPVLVISQLIF
ncbi:hypothetical protein N9904_03750 [Akkermansiaceae bacterium]|nr:hypothetical protein [bacterium]MDB4142882.1 hypothetical protein [Akkermansiaceae bacterium]MDA7610633.1 hypothetical protein [bacterium]MDB4265947.1 hypothetical protein [Akkermansiaceae bacterium]MDB4287209.1 hypothetical protein [bacterium]